MVYSQVQKSFLCHCTLSQGSAYCVCSYHQRRPCWQLALIVTLAAVCSGGILVVAVMAVPAAARLAVLFTHVQCSPQNATCVLVRSAKGSKHLCAVRRQKVGRGKLHTCRRASAGKRREGPWHSELACDASEAWLSEEEGLGWARGWAIAQSGSSVSLFSVGCATYVFVPSQQAFELLPATPPHLKEHAGAVALVRSSGV